MLDVEESRLRLFGGASCTADRTNAREVTSKPSSRALCAGNWATRTSCAAWATAAPAEAPDGAVMCFVYGSYPPSMPTTASYIAEWTMPLYTAARQANVPPTV